MLQVMFVLIIRGPAAWSNLSTHAINMPKKLCLSSLLQINMMFPAEFWKTRIGIGNFTV